MGRGAYAGWRIGLLIGASLLAPVLSIIVVLPYIAISLSLAEKRGKNIGLTQTRSVLIGLIPFLGMLYFCAVAPGSAKKGGWGL